MARYLTTILLLIVGQIVLVQQVDAGIVSVIVNGIEDLFDLGVEIIEDSLYDFFFPPRNEIWSVQYLLFTPASPNKKCYLEQNTDSLEQCQFNVKYPMKFLIHGFLSGLGNDSLVWPMKDRMLELYDYNVVVVNWTKYNQLPYSDACFNAIYIGKELAKLVQFLQVNTGLETKNIHLVGHSLGAHLAGSAGRHLSNLSRITALDPAAPLFSYPDQEYPSVTFEDADFVDVIHTSNITSGFGIDVPIGDMDFFPNNGTHQPQCQTIGVNFTGPESLYTGTCNHDASLVYFLESINKTECTFLSTLCSNYTAFLNGLCSNDSSPMAEMGLHAMPISGLDPKSKFYLETKVSKPYCKEDGYEP